MKIEVSNYKNIKQAKLDIENNKINFLFGISGSGKSSIAKALANELEDTDKRIGATDEIKILVDGQIVKNSNYRLYCEDSVNDLVVAQTDSSGIYNIFFDDEKQLEKIREDYNNKISDLKKIIPQIFEYKGKISTIEKDISSSLAKGNTLKKTSKILKVREDLEKIDREDLRELESLGVDYIDWKLQGSNFEQYSNNLCPFCGKQIDESLVEYINRLKTITPQNFKKLIETSTFKMVEELGIKTPDLLNKDEYDNYLNELIKLSTISNELDKITKYAYFNDEIDINPSNIKELIIDEVVYERFPELKPIILSINAGIDDIKVILGNLKRELDRVINKNAKKINDNLSKLGIPYEFERGKIEAVSRTATYLLKHIDDETGINRTKGLSYGEKNILSLLLFLITKDNKILIVDDPASSYDDYRRKTIFNLLYEFQNDRTILVLSHDQVFTKFAAYFSAKAFNKIKVKTGAIASFENYDGIPIIRKISIDDFKPLEFFVKEQLSAIDDSQYYRKIINVRILSEIAKYDNTEDSKIIYEYTSAILHKKSKTQILKEVADRSTTEEDIILKIREVLNQEIYSIPDDYEKDINYDDWTNFELAIAKRETTTDGTKKEELDNIVHLNDIYAITLNPYKYNYFSPYIYGLINDEYSDNDGNEEMPESTIFQEV